MAGELTVDQGPRVRYSKYRRKWFLCIYFLCTTRSNELIDDKVPAFVEISDSHGYLKWDQSLPFK